MYELRLYLYRKQVIITTIKHSSYKALAREIALVHIRAYSCLRKKNDLPDRKVVCLFMLQYGGEQANKPCAGEIEGLLVGAVDQRPLTAGDGSHSNEGGDGKARHAVLAALLAVGLFGFENR